MVPSLHHIALLVESSRAFGRSLIRGISDYAATRDRWQLHFQESSLGEPLPGWITQRPFDGILARITSAEMADALAALGIPVIDMLGEFPHPAIPRITPDNAAIADAALEHFLQAGHSHLAFCGYPGVHYSDLRQSEFLTAAASQNLSVSLYETGIRGTDLSLREAWHPERHSTQVAWLLSLPKPVAIFCANDLRALDLSAVCRENAIPVPQDVAILGVDDDALVCNMAHPPNSSVKPDAYLHGQSAAAMLADLLAGAPPPADPVLVAPISVVERPSTDRVVTEIPHVAAAFRFIRSHLADSIGVDQIACHLGISRSLLDRDFKQEFGRPLGEEIRQLRLRRIRLLLRNHRLSIDEIARLTGMSGKAALSNFFKSHTGESPGSYRNARRNSP